jgi:hypothetical protein
MTAAVRIKFDCETAEAISVAAVEHLPLKKAIENKKM